MRYSVLRIMLFFGCLLVFFLVRDVTGIPVAAVVLLSAVSSLFLSLVWLRGPREAMSTRLHERVTNRLPPEPLPDSDEAIEDAADEARRTARLDSTGKLDSTEG
jgi:hypothetical protein